MKSKSTQVPIDANKKATNPKKGREEFIERKSMLCDYIDETPVMSAEEARELLTKRREDHGIFFKKTTLRSGAVAYIHPPFQSSLSSTTNHNEKE